MFAHARKYQMKINVVKLRIHAYGKMKLVYNQVVNKWIHQTIALIYQIHINAHGITKHRYVKLLLCVQIIYIQMVHIVNKLVIVIKEIRLLTVRISVFRHSKQHKHNKK